MSSAPAVNAAVVHAGAGPYTLKFNSRIDQKRSTITLITPKGDKLDMPIVPGPQPDILTTMGPAAALAPGAYKIRWQVLSVDGHITRGDIPFTVTQEQ